MKTIEELQEDLRELEVKRVDLLFKIEEMKRDHQIIHKDLSRKLNSVLCLPKDAIGDSNSIGECAKYAFAGLIASRGPSHKSYDSLAEEAVRLGQALAYRLTQQLDHDWYGEESMGR